MELTLAEVQFLAEFDPEATGPPGRTLWTTPEMVDYDHERPMYPMREVAQIFFGMSTHWLRKHLLLDHHVSEEFGKVEPPRRPGSNARRYRLYDIERLAFTFAEHGVITPLQLSYTLRLVRIQARMFGFLDEREMVPVRLDVPRIRRFLLMALMGRLEQLEESPALPPSNSVLDDVLNTTALTLSGLEQRLIETERLMNEDDDIDESTDEQQPAAG